MGKGQDASLGYTGPRFKLGDMYQFQVSDILTNVPGQRLSFSVTSAVGDIVQLNNGSDIYTALGAVLKNERGTFETPFGGLPAEFQVGKKWTGRTTQRANDGKIFELQQESKITGRDVVTVAAGTFQTYVVETVIYIQGGPTLNVKSWIDPRYGYAVKREEMGRWGSRILRSDRRELIAIKAERD